MKILFLSLVVFQIFANAFSEYNPLKDPNICGIPTCEGTGKFKYKPGSQQNYKYSIEVRSLFNGTSKNESTLHVKSLASLRFLTPCDGLLTLSDIKLSEALPREGHESPEHANSQLFADMISEYSLRFSFKDGIISELCPQEEEKSWVLNFKRGILSMLHNTMKRLDLDHITDEEDVRGICPTTYKVIGAKETSLVIEKNKDLSSCSNRAKLHSIVQSTPAFNFQTRKQNENILKATSQCYLSLDHNIYKEITCKEVHLLQPFSNQDAGASTTVIQKLVLQHEEETSLLEEENEITKRLSLLFDHTISSKPTHGELKTSRDLIKKLCKQNKNDFQIDSSDLFTKFIRSLRLLSYPALSALHRHAGTTCPSGKKHLVDALPFVSSSASVALMKDIILSKTIPENTVNEWMMSIAFIAMPDDDMMEPVLQLLEEKTLTSNVALSVASLTHTYCKLHSNCHSNEAVHSIVKHFQNYLLQLMQKENVDREIHDNTILALKALSTIGVISEEFQEELFKLIKDSNLDVAIRVAAVESFRRLPCDDTRSYFEHIYRNQNEDAEVRIAAYLQVMKCPNYLLIRTIRHSLKNEEINQVGSFVWSHLNNLLKTANPGKVEVQSLLSEKDLVKKFNSDIRKFSHNREGSLYFDEYNFGGNYESNVIFSPSSYIPRAAMLNLTADLFGESVNLLEVYGRMEGFEHYFESYFGPKGKSNIIKDKMDEIKMRWTRDAKENDEIENQVKELPNLMENVSKEPKVSLGLKVFGNELKYATFNGDEEIEAAVRTLNPVNYLKRILSGKEINYNKAAMFLDTNYVVPCGAGLPLSMNAIGTASINIKLYGSLNAVGFSKNKELDLTVNIEPTVSLDVTGEMSVDAFYASTGIKLKTNLYTASAIKGDIKVRGSKLVSIKFSLPKQNTKIFGARSELLVKKRDIEHPQSGLFMNRMSDSICSWPVVEQTVGLKLCADYNFINASKLHDAPYFLLAGPAGFSFHLDKSDPTANIYLFEYKWTHWKDHSVVSLTFDTPGSAVKRLLNANMTIDRYSQNLTMLFQSTAGTVLARGKYKNTDDEKFIQLALDINNKKHFDASASIERHKRLNGFTYKPKVYLGVNGETVMELQGSIDLISKRDVSQYTVDLKFHTKRLTSKLFGYISKSESSLATDLHLDYKFLHIKEHRVSLKFAIANRSRKNMAVITGTCDVKSTAYPNYNFNSTVTFQRSGGHLEFKMGLIQNPLPENDPEADFEKLRFDLLFSCKTFTDSKRTINAVVGIVRKSTKLDLRGEILYESINADINMAAHVKYGNNKQVSVTVFWSHPRTTLEQIKAHVNVTIPSFSPMILKVEINERKSRDYKLDVSGTWFSGDSARAVGFYQDKSSALSSNHHIKLFLKSPNFKDINIDLQFYRDNDVLKLDLKGLHDEQNYQLLLSHELLSSQETRTQAKIKYRTKLYTLNSSIYNGDHIKVLVELHIDQIRDIDFSIWIYNQEAQKALSFDINWDANRDPNQKLLIATNFTKSGDFNYNADLVISYPGRTVLGKYQFLLKKGEIDTLASISWDDGKTFAIDFNVLYRYDYEIFLKISSKFLTPFDNWKVIKLFGTLEHLNNKYSLNGELSWDRRERVVVDVFGDYTSRASYFTCKYSCSIASSLDRIPNMNSTITHTNNDTAFDTNLHLMYNPEFVIDLDSKFKIETNKNFTNLTGTIHSQTPFKGLNKGILISKIYLTNNKYLRGVADLDLDHKKMTVNLEGKFKKLMDSRLIINITTPDEEYQCKFIISKEERHFVALLTYPSGDLGVELLINLNSFTDFDTKLLLATPVDFLKNVLILARIKPEQADFRLGWNFLQIGFSGVWHYANITDFEYSYKIYTPIEDFEENGIVGKLIFKEGLDLELSITFSNYKLGIKLIGKSKPKILKELGINVREIYGSSRKSAHEIYDDPLSWEGLIELDAIIYPTMKGNLEIDQKGPTYVLQSKILLPHGMATIFDELEYIDILAIKNNLQITTPYQTFKVVASNFDLTVIPNKKYLFGLNLDYQNLTRPVKTGIYAEYNVERKGLKERIYNITLKVNTPFEAFPNLNLFGAFETEENFYRTQLLFNTNRSDISVDATVEIDNELTEVSSIFYLKTPIINIPECQLRMTKLISEADNYIELNINVPERLRSDIYFRASWLIEHTNKYKTILQLETPFTGMENTTVGIDAYFSNVKSTVWAFVQMHPVQVEVNSTLQNDVLHSTSNLDFNGKKFPVRVICHILRPSTNQREFNGTLLLKDKLFIITGNANVVNGLPMKVLMILTPEDKSTSLKFQYDLKPNLQGYDLTGSIDHSGTVMPFSAHTTIANKFNWKFNLELQPSNATEKIYVDATAKSDTDSIYLDIIGKTPLPKLENPKCGAKYRVHRLTRSLYGYFELPAAKGNINVDIVWKFLENMLIKVVGMFENIEYSSQSSIEAFYENPEKVFHLVKAGGDIKIDRIWASGANVTVKLPNKNNIGLEGHFTVPDDQGETHSFYGNLDYGQSIKFIDYLVKYRTSYSLKKYGTWGKISLEDKKNLSGRVELEWNGKRFNNYANLKMLDKSLNAVYKLKTPKFNDKQLFVATINYKGFNHHHDLTCEAFSPEDQSVAYLTTDYIELANMNGMFNITVPYRSLKYTGAYFKTKTNANVYNRYIKVFWDNDAAILDSKCDIKSGTTLLERNNKGKLIVELPLATRHIAVVDYEYDKKVELSTGHATVKYNGSQVLEGKYNCLSESRAGLDKDTIHVELQNKMVPVGADFVHRHEYGAPRDGYNAPSVDNKYLHLYNLYNRSKFNISGDLNVRTTWHGQEYTLKATHLNRTVKLSTDYGILNQEYKQHSRAELSPTIWLDYDLSLVNKTKDEIFDAQLLLIKVSYPLRNFTAQGFYNISDSIISTDVSLVWDKDNKTVQAVLDWRRASFHREQLQLQIKHPSFEKDVSFVSKYGYDKSSIDGQLVVDYSNNPDQRLTLRGKIEDKSDVSTRDYAYKIWAEHNATSLYLDSVGDFYWDRSKFGTDHHTNYKRSYLPLLRFETLAKVDLELNEIELRKQNIAGLSYFWGRYGGNFPVYTANISAAHGINDTSGEFYLNLRKKLLYLNLNMTQDGSQSLHMYGIIPDARSSRFDIWRDYEDKSVSDVAYYLRLNHSRLIMSSLRWRPELISDVQNGIRGQIRQLYYDTLEEVNNTKHYIRAESMDAIHGIWQDAKPIVQNFLVDLRNLTIIEEDIKYLKIFLNESYNTNEFYIKDISTMIMLMFDELSLKTHLQSLPKIVQEMWDVMGESGQKIKKSINWVIEQLKTYYKNTTEFIHDLINGDPVEHISKGLGKIIEKYDTFIKNMHVAILQYMEALWGQTYDLIVEYWHRTLAALEPTFLKFIHYLETIVWSTGKEFLDFLYIRKNKIIESAYFMEFTKFSRDVDSFYKDITGNNTIEAIYKYSNIAWSFIQEKYIKHIPFAKEIQAIFVEIWTELQQLANIPSIRYLINKYYETFGYVKYYYTYFEVQTRIHNLIKLIYSKFADMSVTALEIENRNREAKTKFIFEPDDGIMLMEQKLPMSWHAFNETPKFQEIPEIKTMYDIQNYFTTSQISFWNFYYDYKPYTDLSEWLPPFKGHAMLMGSKYYVTFDKIYYNFQGTCTYLLATDFRDRNFTLLVSYDHVGKTNELVLLINKTVVRIGLSKDSITVGNTGMERLPVQIGDTYLYRDSDILTVDSASGFSLECNMKFHICIFEMTGWYFGRTAGLWGTYNNEPYDDFVTSTKQRTNSTDLNMFGDSWSLDKTCKTKELSENKAKEVPQEIASMCNEFFNSKVSELSTCFPRIPKDSFLSMCLESTTENEACMSAVAYINLCAYDDTPVRIPDTCVKCNLPNGTEIQEGDFIQLQGGGVFKTADIVFIVEAKKCNKDLRHLKNFDIVVDLINQELIEMNITDNRYALVVFGGDGVYDKPRSVIINGLTFASSKSILKYFDNIPMGNGNVDLYNALLFANKLIFRPGASRNFILIPCSECQEYNMEHEYSIIHQLLFDNAVSLHILMNDSFTLQAGESRKRDSKIPFGVDLGKAYTKKDIRNLVGDQVLRDSINLPKSSLGLCFSLALETNGTVFSASHLELQKNAKKFSTVFAKRVARSAVPRDCMACECTGANTGVSFMECYPCAYPRSNFETYYDDDDIF